MVGPSQARAQTVMDLRAGLKRVSEALSIGKKVGLGVRQPRVMEDEYMEGWVPGSLIS